MIALRLAIIALIACATAAQAENCPRKGTLGTARELAVDPHTYPRVGTQSFPQTLPLADKEVVLTFDDGPWRPTTTRILAALAHECVKATFFIIGRSAMADPELVREIAAAGHTIGYHTWSHQNLAHISPSAAVTEIDRGIEAVETALHGTATTVPSTPFFRFPYFESTPAELDLLQSRGIAVFGADLWAGDWEEKSAPQELKDMIGWLSTAHKGIILFHDPKARTAAIMPAFLRYLRDNSYRVVHIVAAPPTKDKNAASGAAAAK
jgi:peptidoglycan/xylan/chitin deacetylase (PgdA/CDA1 family)